METDFDIRKVQDVILRIKDENDNPPRFNNPALVNRGILNSATPQNRKVLYEVSATDLDFLPENKNVSFRISEEKIIELTEGRKLRQKTSKVNESDSF